MSEPTDRDLSYQGDSARESWQEHQQPDHNLWCYASLKEVEGNMASTGYPMDKLRFVQGKVEETIPQVTPEAIALLRLDTDLYESTYHELVHLFPRLSPGGVLIIDDYGHWLGCREATDRYFIENPTRILLNRIDSAAVLGVKP